jgi:hypothetical protein
MLRLRFFLPESLYDAFNIATATIHGDGVDETEANGPRRHAKCSQDSDLNVIHFTDASLIVACNFLLLLMLI